MRKRILAYRKKIDEILGEGGEYDWETLRANHLVQISFFQHERLIHLIVTALFALIEFALAAVTVTAFSPEIFALCILVLALIIPYVGHYYLLENEVQKLYAQYDFIEENCERLRAQSRQTEDCK